MKIIRLVAALCAAAISLAFADSAVAQNNWISRGGSDVNGYVMMCLDAQGFPVPVDQNSACPGGGGAGGSSTPFTPNGNYGTLTATAASSASTALPTGATVAFQNTSAVDVSCVLSSGAASATTNKIVVRAGSTVFVAPGTNTNTACINQSGSASNVVVLAGGTGLGTNFGGSSGGGGGTVTQGPAGASPWLVTGTGGTFPVTGTFWQTTQPVSVASGAVASGAYSAGSYAAGALVAGAAVDGWDVTQGAKGDAAYGGSGSASAISLLKGIYASVNGSIPACTGSPCTTVIGVTGIDQTTPGTTNGVSASGNVASGSTDSGAPVKVGGVFNTTQPTVTDGQRVDAQYSNRGEQKVQLSSGALTASLVASSGGTDGNATTNTSLQTRPYTQLFNGSTWDRAFTCTQQASVNVTAGSTTQIVALSGSTVIRICSINISMSLAGTFSQVSGTGTNCATPANATADMALATGTPMNVSAPAGGSLYRGSAGGEYCVKAVTGNVTGWVTYAQF